MAKASNPRSRKATRTPMEIVRGFTKTAFDMTVRFLVAPAAPRAAGRAKPAQNS